MNLSNLFVRNDTSDYYNLETTRDNNFYNTNLTNNVNNIISDNNGGSPTSTTTDGSSGSSSYTNFILNLTLINNHNYSNYFSNNNNNIFNFYGDDFNSSPLLTSYNSANSLNTLSNTLNSNSSIFDYHFVAGTSGVAGANGTKFDYTKLQKEFIFDRIYVRIIFISLYSLVFCCCFFGNLLVILVVTLSRRLRSITNFFLANLAVADLCVGVFCVMQNLSIYLIPSWVFGEFLCKMYQFVHSLSYTASIFILVVICMERYFAIIHPIQCKQILTSKRLRLVIVGVWITSAIYSIPKFIFVRIINNTFSDGSIELICISNRKLYNSKLFDLFNFGFLYLTPLLVMSILYSRIAIALWKSSRGLERNIVMKNTPVNSTSTQSPATISKTIPFRMSVKYDCNNMECSSNQMNSVSPMPDKVYRGNTYMQRHGAQLAQISNSSQNVLRARRGVIRMLIVVVLIFALCNLPFHARKLWQYWSNDYQGDSNFNAIFTPLTFLVTYFNSGVNPLLYAFLSRNFRKGMRELLLCSLKKNKNKSQNLRVPLQELRLIQQSHSSQCSDVIIIPVIEIK